MRRAYRSKLRNGAARGVLADGGEIAIRGGRHPCLDCFCTLSFLAAACKVGLSSAGLRDLLGCLELDGLLLDGLVLLEPAQLGLIFLEVGLDLGSVFLAEAAAREGKMIKGRPFGMSTSTTK